MIKYKTISKATIEVKMDNKRTGSLQSRLVSVNGLKVRHWQYVPVGKKWDADGFTRPELHLIKQHIEIG